MEHSRFIRELAQKMVAHAAKKDEEYVLMGGKLKKGQWHVLPNGSHVFTVDGAIQAGPVNLIGKNPKTIATEELSKAEPQSEIPPNPDVAKKYYNSLEQTRSMPPKRKENTLERLHRKMNAEDDSHLTFFQDHQPTPAMHELAQAFSDYGDMPINGTPQDQSAWYGDRLSLLRQLRNNLGQESQGDVDPHIEHIQDQLDNFKSKHGLTPPPPDPVQESMFKPEPKSAPTPAPAAPKLSTPPPTVTTPTTPPPTPTRKSRPKPKAPPPKPSTYNVSGPNVVQDEPFKPANSPLDTTYRIPKNKIIQDNPSKSTVYSKPPPAIIQDKPYYRAIRAKDLNMLKIESGLRNSLITCFGILDKSTENDRELFNSLTKEVLSCINTNE